MAFLFLNIIGISIKYFYSLWFVAKESKYSSREKFWLSECWVNKFKLLAMLRIANLPLFETAI